MTVQAGSCQTWPEPKLLVFSRTGLFIPKLVSLKILMLNDVCCMPGIGGIFFHQTNVSTYYICQNHILVSQQRKYVNNSQLFKSFRQMLFAFCLTMLYFYLSIVFFLFIHFFIYLSYLFLFAYTDFEHGPLFMY